jgi:hypothetical protein
MTRITVLSIALASLLLCSHRAIAAPIKACDFMTAQTASSVFGSIVNAGREESLPMAAQQCVFDHNDPAAPGQIAFSVADAKAMADAAGTDIPGLTRFLKQSEDGQKSETIPSLGEWNSYVWNGLTDYTLTVLYHGKVLLLLSSGSKNPNLKTALVQAMRQTMQKL